MADAVDAGKKVLKRIDSVCVGDLSAWIGVVRALQDPIANGFWGLMALRRL